jgi:hypothetical protein
MSERTLVDALKFVLGQADAESLYLYMKEKEIKEKTRHVLVELSGRDHFLNLILSVPHNDVFLTRHLKRLSPSDLVGLMDYLRSGLERSRTMSEGVPKRKPPSRLPRMAQLLDWITMLIDSHFAQLVLTAEHHSVLIDIYETVLELLEEYEKTQDLKGFLSLFERHTKLPAKDFQNYSIELLHQV